jgi:hypothetical protein
LIMPERSENIPPRAAKIKGVANRIAEKIKDKVKSSDIKLFLRVFLETSHE